MFLGSLNLSFLRNLLMLHVLTAVSVWLTVPQLLQHGEVCNAMQTKAKGSFFYTVQTLSFEYSVHIPNCIPTSKLISGFDPRNGCTRY